MLTPVCDSLSLGFLSFFFFLEKAATGPSGGGSSRRGDSQEGGRGGRTAAGGGAFGEDRHRDAARVSDAGPGVCFCSPEPWSDSPGAPRADYAGWKRDSHLLLSCCVTSTDCQTSRRRRTRTTQSESITFNRKSFGLHQPTGELSTKNARERLWNFRNFLFFLACFFKIK